MKPSDLYLGVLHFFSILLPGSVLAMLILWSGHIDGVLPQLGLSHDVERWAAFLLASYGLGHLTFLIASSLDWLVYDFLRKIIWPNKSGDAYSRATALREAQLQKHFDDTEVMNTFTWSKASLLRAWPDASAEVQRFEADSKFFRSLTIVAIAAAIQLAMLAQQNLAYIAAIIATLSLLRYVEQRRKSTTWAYRYILILHMQGPPTKNSAPKQEDAD